MYQQNSSNISLRRKIFLENLKASWIFLLFFSIRNIFGAYLHMLSFKELNILTFNWECDRILNRITERKIFQILLHSIAFSASKAVFAKWPSKPENSKTCKNIRKLPQNKVYDCNKFIPAREIQHPNKNTT